MARRAEGSMPDVGSSNITTWRTGRVIAQIRYKSSDAYRIDFPIRGNEK